MTYFDYELHLKSLKNITELNSYLHNIPEFIFSEDSIDFSFFIKTDQFPIMFSIDEEPIDSVVNEELREEFNLIIRIRHQMFRGTDDTIMGIKTVLYGILWEIIDNFDNYGILTFNNEKVLLRKTNELVEVDNLHMYLPKWLNSLGIKYETKQLPEF